MMLLLIIAHKEREKEGAGEWSIHFIIHFYAFFIHHQHHSRSTRRLWRWMAEKYE